MALMEGLVAARQGGEGRDTLLLLEHTPVITLGRRAETRHILAPADELERRGVELRPSTRGGQVTYHGPGQLVAYPVVRLEAGRQDVHRYLRDLEEALIRLAAGYGVEAHRVPGRTGVWVGKDKLASIGIRVSRWVTSHGVALNVARDLSGFDLIVPCGLEDAGVTSLGRLLGWEPSLEEVALRLAPEMARLLGRSLHMPSRQPP
jgi:lipoyl(octanoyl) transferase